MTISTETGQLRNNGDGFEHSIDIVQYYRKAYNSELEGLGLDLEMIDALIADIKNPGPSRDAYQASLYGAGDRDSRYSLQVNFQAYIDASK
ncbi:MAG TPA: hypothetical protein DCQ06_05635 [Myxococcales bacterium]|nr:hypothetical protein [Myxococcales bacterium]